MVKARFSRHLFHKILGEASERENGLPQGILGDLAEEEGLVFDEVGPPVQSHRWVSGERNASETDEEKFGVKL